MNILGNSRYVCIKLKTRLVALRILLSKYLTIFKLHKHASDFQGQKDAVMWFFFLSFKISKKNIYGTFWLEVKHQRLFDVLTNERVSLHIQGILEPTCLLYKEGARNCDFGVDIKQLQEFRLRLSRTNTIQKNLNYPSAPTKIKTTWSLPPQRKVFGLCSLTKYSLWLQYE